MAYTASHPRVPVIFDDASIFPKSGPDYPADQFQLGTLLYSSYYGILYQCVLNRSGARVWVEIGGPSAMAMYARAVAPMVFAGGITADAVATVNGYLANTTGVTASATPLQYPLAYYGAVDISMQVARLVVAMQANATTTTDVNADVLINTTPIAISLAIPPFAPSGQIYTSSQSPVTVSAGLFDRIDLRLQNTAGGAGNTCLVSARIEFSVV